MHCFYLLLQFSLNQNFCQGDPLVIIAAVAAHKDDLQILDILCALAVHLAHQAAAFIHLAIVAVVDIGNE